MSKYGQNSVTFVCFVTFVTKQNTLPLIPDEMHQS